MQVHFRSLIVASLAGLMAACVAPRQMKVIEAQNARMQAQIDSLRLDNQRLHAALRNSQRSGASSDEAFSKLQADSQLRLNQFDTRIQQLSDRMDDIDSRLHNLPQKWQMVSQSLQNLEQAQPTGSDLSAAVANEADMQQLYNNAYQDLVKGQYALAREGFNEFLRRFPNTTLSDNAQYWIGESYYAEKSFSRAAAEFAAVGERFPQGDKVVAAQLKQAYALVEIGQISKAKRLLQDIIQQQSNSPEASLARAKLNTL